jgi:LAO/AO transport system kinase
MTELATAILTGDRRALARLITQIENGRPEARASVAALYPKAGRAQLIGVTGAPGTGKSTLVNELARWYRSNNLTVAVIAVDPTSPFTGGAILGDRIRMRDLAGDPGVYIRSMATRGSLGGLAWATAEAAGVLDAAGFDRVLIETVGAGQSEVDIAQLAHTTLVVEAPGLGDDVQAIKAGILEIADILVVNKADQPNAAETVRALRAMLSLAHPAPGALPVAICETVASESKGVAELVVAIDAHTAHWQRNGHLGERTAARARRQVELTLRERLYQNFMNKNGSHDKIGAAVEAVVRRELDPYSAVEQLL